MPNLLSLTDVRRPSPGWYRGDFHVHTTFSDGHYTPPDLARLCVEHGLDFFVITDHNAIGSFNLFGEDPGLLVIPGLEVTLNEGHWNVFGVEGWRPWMEAVCYGEITIPLGEKFSGTNELLALTRGEGRLNSINHPLLAPWAWVDKETDLRLVDAIEVWSDPLWPDNAAANPRAVDLWSECLNAGLRPAAIGGSDFHCLPGEMPPYPGEKPGLPLTWVYARELSGQAVLEGVRARRAFVSLGPKMAFHAALDGQRFEMGADMGPRNGRAMLEASVSDGPQMGILRLVGSMGVVAEAAVVAGQAGLQCDFGLREDRPQWVRAEVVDADGRTLALTNPVFAGQKTDSAAITFGEIVRRTEG